MIDPLSIFYSGYIKKILPTVDYRDLIKRNNRGVLIEEKDNSVFSVTRFNNRITLVLGCSAKGVINSPVLVVSPENFIEIFGDIDYSLERKGSYFQRTVLNLLRHGPVICVNLRQTDAEKDKLNWVALSTSSAHANAATRTNPRYVPWLRPAEMPLLTIVDFVPLPR